MNAYFDRAPAKTFPLANSADTPPVRFFVRSIKVDAAALLIFCWTFAVIDRSFLEALAAAFGCTFWPGLLILAVVAIGRHREAVCEDEGLIVVARYPMRIPWQHIDHARLTTARSLGGWRKWEAWLAGVDLDAHFVEIGVLRSVRLGFTSAGTDARGMPLRSNRVRLYSPQAADLLDEIRARIRAWEDSPAAARPAG